MAVCTCVGLGVKFVSDQRNLSSLIDGVTSCLAINIIIELAFIYRSS